MHLTWGNTNVLYVIFSFFYWFQLEKMQIWRRMNKCRSYTASWQPSWEDTNSALPLAHFACFCLLWVLRESHNLNPKALWVELWFSVPVPGEGRHSVIQRKFECWHTASFLSLGASHGFSWTGLLQRKDFTQIWQGGSQKTWSLLVLDWAACAEAVLPSTVKRVLYGASDCLIFSLSPGRVAE